MDRSRIDVYEAGGRKLLDAFRGLTKEDLLAQPIPGTWSLQQIAVHMMDSDLIGADRMKRIASMSKPLLIGYDETAFNQLPGVNDLDAMEVCEHFARNRRFTAIVLRGLSDEAFQRCGIHSESGLLRLEEMLEKYIHHLDGHLHHVYAKRALLGKPA